MPACGAIKQRMTTATAADGRGAAGLHAETQRWFQQRVDALMGNISRAVVVSEETVRFVLLGLVSRGHILLEDIPGVGKTLMAKSLAQSIEGVFSRIQCTSDLLPSDITGTSVFDMSQSCFEFKPGPVFSNILLADEINRTGPRTQSALLEAMAEFQVSADGRAYLLPRPFMVIATQNAAESHGIYPLPDSQLDRFLIRMSLGLPTEAQESDILSRAEHSPPELPPVVSAADVQTMQEVVVGVNVSPSVRQYLVKLAQTSRSHPEVLRGTSPRGTVLLQHATQGWGAFEGRRYVIPEDVKQVAPLVLSHRMVERPASSVSSADIIGEILDAVPVPP